MKSVKISLQMAQKVKDFVKVVQDCPYEIDLKSDKYVVDAKSILGIFQAAHRGNSFGQLRRPYRSAQTVPVIRSIFTNANIRTNDPLFYESGFFVRTGNTSHKRYSACRSKAKRLSTS